MWKALNEERTKFALFSETGDDIALMFEASGVFFVTVLGGEEFAFDSRARAERFVYSELSKAGY